MVYRNPILMLVVSDIEELVWLYELMTGVWKSHLDATSVRHRRTVVVIKVDECYI